MDNCKPLVPQLCGMCETDCEHKQQEEANWDMYSNALITIKDLEEGRDSVCNQLSAAECSLQEAKAEIERLEKYERLCDDVFGICKMVFWDSGKVGWNKERAMIELKQLAYQSQKLKETLKDIERDCGWPCEKEVLVSAIKERIKNALGNKKANVVEITKREDFALECECGSVTWHFLRSGQIECANQDCQLRRDPPVR